MSEDMGAFVRKNKEIEKNMGTLIKTRSGGLPDLWAKDGVAGESFINRRIGSTDKMNQIQDGRGRSRQNFLETSQAISHRSSMSAFDQERSVDRLHTTGLFSGSCEWCNKGPEEHNWPENQWGNPDY